MNPNPPHLAVTGAAMDKRVPRRRGKRIAYGVATAVTLAAVVYAMWSALPHGLQVSTQDVRIARAEKGVFIDDIVVRAVAEPLHSVILDSVESGRVEEVLARDGAIVAKGQLLFRLSNPQRNLELLARPSRILPASRDRCCRRAIPFGSSSVPPPVLSRGRGGMPRNVWAAS